MALGEIALKLKHCFLIYLLSLYGHKQTIPSQFISPIMSQTGTNIYVITLC